MRLFIASQTDDLSSRTESVQRESVMAMTVLDRAELEESLALLEKETPDIAAAAAKLRHALNHAAALSLLTTTEAAAALGVRSVNTIKYWCKTGYIQGVKRGERTMIPLAEIDRITGEDRVRSLRVADTLMEETRRLGDSAGLTDAELRSLKAARPGTAPWER